VRQNGEPPTRLRNRIPLVVLGGALGAMLPQALRLVGIRISLLHSVALVLGILLGGLILLIWDYLRHRGSQSRS
jgi:hypothetical protein